MWDHDIVGINRTSLILLGLGDKLIELSFNKANLSVEKISILWLNIDKMLIDLSRDHNLEYNKKRQKSSFLRRIKEELSVLIDPAMKKEGLTVEEIDLIHWTSEFFCGERDLEEVKMQLFLFCKRMLPQKFDNK